MGARRRASGRRRRSTGPTAGRRGTVGPAAAAALVRLVRLVLLVLLVAGCTVPGSDAGSEAAGSTPDAVAPDPRWEQLPAPQSPTDGERSTDVTALLGASGDLPPLLVGSLGTRPAAPLATAWHLGDTGWAPTTLPDGDGLTVTEAAADGLRTWLAGSRWDPDRGVTAALLSSTDRRTWQEEPLTGLPEGAYPAALLPTEDGLVLLGRTVDDVPFSRRPADPGEWLPLPLAGGPTGRVLDAVARDGTLVTLLSSAETGGTEVVSPVVSTDAGRSWSVGQALPGDGAGASGLAVVEDGVVATGWVQQDGRAVPASWVSGDGVVWTAEDVMGESGLSPVNAPGVDIWLGAPTVRSGQVVAPVALRASLLTFLLERTDDGWREVGVTVPSWHSPGVDPTVVGDGDGLLLAQSQWGGVRVRRGTDEDWQEWQLGSARAVPTVTGLAPTPDGVVLRTDSERVAVEPDSTWLTTSLSLPHRISPEGEVTALPWPGGPPELDVDGLAAQLSGVVMTTTGDGITVVLGERYADADSDTDLAGWLDAADGSRRLVEGFAGPTADWVRASEQVGDWYAVGGSRPELAATATASAQVWRSDDGVSWAPLAGDYRAADETDSVAVDVCAGPDGQVLVVGTAQVQDAERAVVWRVDGEAATRVWTSDAGQDTVVEGCGASTGAEGAAGAAGSAETAGRTLLSGEVDGVPTLWSTTDGTRFASTALGETGLSFGPVRALPGGFAAAGRRNGGDGAWTGAVVHLSADGEAWRTLRLPATRLTDGVDVAPLGEDLLVAGDTPGGPQLWVLRDYAAQLSGR